MALKSAARDIGFGFGGAVLGAVIVLLAIGTKTVPPPPFTGASFGNGASPRVVKGVKVYAWNDRAKVPAKDSADRGDPDKWVGGMAPADTQDLLDLAPLSTNYFATVKAFGVQNIVAAAVVVEAENGSMTERYINFIPQTEPLVSTLGISHLNCLLSLDGEGEPVLSVRYFFGAEHAPDQFTDDSDFFKK